MKKNGKLPGGKGTNTNKLGAHTHQCSKCPSIVVCHNPKCTKAPISVCASCFARKPEKGRGN